MLSHITSLDSIKTKRLAKMRLESEIRIAVVQDNSSLTEHVTMARKVQMGYLENLDKFIKRLSKQRAEGLIDNDSIAAIGVYQESGRRYDKIMISTLKKDAANAKIEVKFFVDRETGAIYGAKSPVAPNDKRYFGTIYNATKWDWSQEWPKNISDDSVTEGRGYGDICHYRPK